ncbi:hypothetical protein BaRGS_00023961 [Batillaria attramentaria]
MEWCSSIFLGQDRATSLSGPETLASLFPSSIKNSVSVAYLADLSALRAYICHDKTPLARVASHADCLPALLTSSCLMRVRSGEDNPET